MTRIHTRIRFARALIVSVLFGVVMSVGSQPAKAATDCWSQYHMWGAECCIVNWSGDTSCTYDNPDLWFEWYGSFFTVEGFNLKACSFEMCQPYCVEAAGTYIDESGVEQPMMRWLHSLGECRCDEVDSEPPEADPTHPQDCIVPVDPSIVVNEVDYSHPGTDSTDFVEILNTDSSPVDLGLYHLELVLARKPATPFDNVIYNSIQLPSVTLHPGEYFVVCADSDAVADCDLEVPEADLIKPGYWYLSRLYARAVALVRGFHVVDVLSYEGDSLDPYAEGGGTQLMDSDQPYVSLSRTPDGADTQENAWDFVLKCVSPGSPNLDASTDCAESPNQPPVAMAGIDQSVECQHDGAASVGLDGSGSHDPDSTPGTNDDILIFEWFLDFGLPTEMCVGLAETVETVLPLGSHTITLRVTDSFGLEDIDDVVLAVVDTIRPEIGVELEPDLLWPPNHRMIQVHASVAASDRCGAPQVVLSSVVSSEADDMPGGGDGNTANDIQGARTGRLDFDFELRAERSGKGAGRIYTVTYTATDKSGNTRSAQADVHVAHDARRGAATRPK